MKSPGQIAYEASMTNQQLVEKWENLHPNNQRFWEKIGQAVLESQWRSVDEPPEDQSKTYLLAGGELQAAFTTFAGKHHFRTHWMPIPEPPKPKELTPEEKEKIEFKCTISVSVAALVNPEYWALTQILDILK